MREQLGALLLKLDQPKEAQPEFEATLKIYPGRFQGLYAAALAAEQIGEKKKATRYFAKLTEQTAKADSSRNELAQLRGISRHRGRHVTIGQRYGTSQFHRIVP